MSLESERNNPWFKPWFNILLHTQSIVCATLKGQCLEYLGNITLCNCCSLSLLFPLEKSGHHLLFAPIYLPRELSKLESSFLFAFNSFESVIYFEDFIGKLSLEVISYILSLETRMYLQYSFFSNRKKLLEARNVQHLASQQHSQLKIRLGEARLLEEHRSR